jgi:hypothetical protein
MKCGVMEETTSGHNILVGKPKRKKPIGVHGHAWENTIQTYREKKGVKVLIGFNWLRELQNTVKNLWFTTVGRFLTSCETMGYSTSTLLHRFSVQIH